MGKIGGNSWLNIVKKAFRSSTKDTKKSIKRREEHEEEDDEKVINKFIYCTPTMHISTRLTYSRYMLDL